MGHLRIMSEGCQGALMAYQLLEEKQGQKKPQWLAFGEYCCCCCLRFLTELSDDAVIP